jgi:hypothetical protein
MKQYLLILLFFTILICLPVLSQVPASQRRLSGRILVRENNQQNPFEYATVRLLSAKDSTLIAGTTTDRLGRFELAAATATLL